MKKGIVSVFAFMLFSVSACLGITVDTYDVTMRMRAPRVYNNTESEGYRKYQWQNIYGTMTVSYSDDSSDISVDFGEFTNRTYKVGGFPVTYTVSELEDEYISSEKVYIGNNRTDVFRTASMSVKIDMYPSYMEGVGDDEPDNSFILQCSMTGSSKDCSGNRIPYLMYGYAVGNQGCGCMIYGHKSPTRRWSSSGVSDIVVDKAPCYGTIKVKFSKREVVE